MGIVRDWFFETGDEVQYFGPDEPLTQDVRDTALEAWGAEGYPIPWDYTEHSLDDRSKALNSGAVGLFIRENAYLAVSIIGLGSMTPEGQVDPDGSVLGSFDEIIVSEARDGTVRFEVINTMGWASGTRIPGTNDWLIDNRPRNAWGPGGTIEQHFIWWERYP